MDPYQAIVGQFTVTVSGHGISNGSNNCGELVPENPDRDLIGPDVEFHFLNGGIPDINVDGIYTYDAVCFTHTPVIGKNYGYGSQFDDQIMGFNSGGSGPDSSRYPLMEVRPFYQALKRGYPKDFVIYVTNDTYGRWNERGVTKLMASEFIQKYESGDFSEQLDYSVISPEVGNDVIRGGDGDDIIGTNGGNDEIYGEAGNDILSDFSEDIDVTTYVRYASDPNVDPNWNSAKLYGGPGDDVYYLRDTKDQAIEVLGEGFDIAFCDYYYDDTYPDFVMGKGGYKFNYDTEIEVIAGKCASLPPHFTGRYYPNLYLQPSAVRALSGKGTSLSDAVVSYEDSLTFDSGDGNDLVLTGTGQDNIVAGAGDDLVVPGPGTDIVSLGAGNDLIIDNSSTAVSQTAASANSGKKSLYAESAAQNVLDDRYDGGSGSDSLKYSVLRSGAIINYQSDGSVNVSVDGKTDVLRNIEVIQFVDIKVQLGNSSANTIGGTSESDELSGLAGNDTLNGYGGGDLLDGGSGADKMTGGDGGDVYIVDNGSDTVTEASTANSGNDTVKTTLPSYTLPANVENLIYIGSSNFSGTGNSLANTITGGPGNDALNGSTGVDVMYGGAGNDSYTFDNASDLANEDPDKGTDTISSPLTVTMLSANVENLTLTGKAVINGTGNLLDNAIVGNSAANILAGGNGSDTLNGGAGNDTFYGNTSAVAGTEIDTISFAGTTGAVTFNLGLATAQATGGAGTDTIPNGSIENLVGGAGADTLTGTAIGNRISGAAGNDAMFGLVGADVLIGDVGLDKIDCGADSDIDTVAYAATNETPVGINRDQISNFKIVNDKIDVSVIDANSSVSGNQAFTFNTTTAKANSIWYAISGSDIIVRGDVNGNTTADFEILVKGVTSVSAANFNL